MDFKIDDICSRLSIGKSTIYKRLNSLKLDIPVEKHRNNEYFYYTEKNKLFITEKGFDFIKSFKPQSYNCNSLSPYYDDVISLYKARIDYLENENKRLLDIIALKEQKEIAKDVKFLNSSNNSNSFFSKLLSVFKGS